MKLLSLQRAKQIKAKSITAYQVLGAIFVFLGLVVLVWLLIQPKLHNPQVELAQPDGPATFALNLTALPRFGQTFVAHQAGLQGIYLPLSVEALRGDAALTLHLRADPESVEDIRIVTLPLAGFGSHRLARFTFDPLPNSFNKRYYFFIEPGSEPGSEAQIELRYSGPTTYADGALYLDGEPQDLQANFFLAYDRAWILRDWAGWLAQNGFNFLALLLLTTLPGTALLVWLWSGNLSEVFDEDHHLNLIEWIALAVGLSSAIYPIFLLLANLFGITLGSKTILLFLMLSGLATIGGVWQKQRPEMWNRLEAAEIVPGLLRAVSRLAQTSLSPPLLLFWLIFVLSAGVRLVVVRGQAAPLWQDSYHHAMISQLIVDNGGLFQSWMPYAPLESFSYHFGFHAIVAAYHWLTGHNILQAVLATGQWLNILTVPLAFLLGRRLGGSDWVGTFAAMITGLLSEYPMFYVNWGRYTQLAGQVILPAAMILTWFALKTGKPNFKLLSLTALSVAGLALTHYRVLFFYPCFVGPALLFQWRQEKWQPAKLRTYSLRLAMIALGSFILISPWLWRVIGGRLWQVNSSQLVAGTENKFAQTIINMNPNVFDFVSPLIVILGIIGLIWGSWQRRAGIFLTAMWGILLVLISNPHFLYLPGAVVIPYFAVLIAAYLPFSILAGFTLANVTQALTTVHATMRWGVVAFSLGIGLLGAQARLVSFQPDNAMVTRPDLAAMDWIQTNISPKAVFWTNARSAYTGSAVVGTDAGWWIPLLAKRQGLVLPMIYGTERTNPVDYPAQIVAWHQQIYRDGSDPEAMWRALRQAGVTHLYIGQRRGEVWRGDERPLDPVALEHDPHYRLVYKQDQVRIFELE